MSRAINVNPWLGRFRLKFRNVEALHQEHGAAATRALPYSPRTCFGLDGSETARRCLLQQSMAERQQGFAPAVGQESEEADADEAMRKYMEKEAPQKLLCCHCHELLFAAVGVILPAERHLIIGEVYEPVVGDGDTMCIAGQVMKNVPRATEGRLGVHDPVLAKKRAQERMEGALLCKWSEGAGERQLFLSKCFFQASVELPSKDTAEHLHGQKECVARMNPPLVIERKTTGRDHAMDMWMMQDVLPPRM